ncbi:MAG: hypothetical protein JO316_01265 [Abitibacteriaceae bacterium]|nr:hypothetical protein [Abditibacteriaceae bacterium]MBV9863959.1 hypothetical protein [Abditibacteriaceae bacterium]
MRLRVAAGLLLGLLGPCRLALVQAQEIKVPLKPEMVLDEAGRDEGNAPEGVARLVDEQALAGDPATGQGGTPVTSWFPGWTKWYYPASGIIDLGATYHLSRIFVYDGAGTGSFAVSTGVPFAWQPLFTDSPANYQKWNEHPADVTTRYLRVTLGDPGTKVPEIVVYARGSAPASPAVTPAIAHPRPARPTIDQFIGTNAFIDDPVDKIAVGGWVREYHSWDWDEGDRHDYAGYPNNQNRWNPSAAGGGGWNFDDYYTKLNQAGVMPSPCIQGSTFWLAGKDANKLQWKPVPAGADPTLPASYVAHADHLFQYAARYGQVAVPDARLKLAPGQPRRSGLGLLHYYENYNEQDRWWAGPEAWFSPYEFAAMSSADYDGDRGKLGQNVGIKNADPNAKLVMGGLARLSLDYIRAMKLWSDHYRGGSFPFDVINLHHYSNNGGEQQRGSVGISPEADHLREKLQQFVTYRDQNLPGVEVWMTEFGYDLNQGSPQHAPAIKGYAPEEVQAQWLVRSYLALAAAGVDRAAMYMLRDVNPADPTQFSSSGLVGPKGDWTPRTSWYYVYTLKNRLKGMNFVNEQASGNPKVTVYHFKAARGPGEAYVLWCPTSDGSIVTDYALPVAFPQATLVSLTKGQTTGEAAPLAIQNGQVTVTVSERPIIVVRGT